MGLFNLLKFNLIYYNSIRACVISCFSRVRLFATLWTIVCQARLSIAFSRGEYWSGLSFPTQGDLPNSGIQPRSPVSPALWVDALPTQPARTALGEKIEDVIIL